jgi:hypothetical protein
MADQYNAFSLDPLQLEQDQIAQQMRMAEAAALRRGTGRGSSRFDIGNDAIMDTAANMAQSVTIPNLQHRQGELSKQFQQSFDEATVGAPDQIKALIKNPATRPQGMQLLLEYNQDQMDKINGMGPSAYVTKPGANSALPGATAAAGAVAGGGSAPAGGGDPTPQEMKPGPGQFNMEAIRRGMGSRNAHTAAVAKVYHDDAVRQQDPDKLGTLPDGSAAPLDPNQIAALQRKAQLAAATQAINVPKQEIKLPNGDIGYAPPTDPAFPTSKVLGLPTQTQSEVQGGRALPGAVAAAGPPQGQPPVPQGGPPQGQPPVPQGPAPQQRPMAQAPVPAGPGMAQGTSMQIPPEVQAQREAQAFQMLQGELQKAVQAGDAQAATQIDREIRTRFPKGPPQVPAAPPGGPPPGAPPQAPAAAPAASAPINLRSPIDTSGRPKGDVTKGYESYIDPKTTIQMPPSQYANPMQEKMYQDRVNENHATMSKMEAAYHPGELSHLLDQAEDIIYNKPHLTGSAAQALIHVYTAGPHADEATANTIALNAISQKIAGLMVKANQTTQISDFDYKVGQMQAPSMDMPLEAQMKVFEGLREGSQYLDGMHNAVRKGVYNNIPANEVASAYGSWYKDALEHNAKLKAAAENPTSAPAGSSPAAGKGAAAPFEYKEPGTFGRIGGFLSDKTAYGDMAKALPSTIAGIATNPTAWKDAIMDKGRGIQNFFGAGDREESVKLLKGHEDRAAQDPQGYGAGYNFANTVPETIAYTAAAPEMAALKGVKGALDLARVAAPSVARTTAVGAASGASRPEESWGQQGVNAAFGAAAGLAGSLLPAALPATRLAAGAGGKAVEEILTEFPRLRSTLSRAQINPGAINDTVVGGVPTVRAVQQVQAISDDIAIKAGLKPGRLDSATISNAKTATAKETEGILTSGAPTKVDAIDKQFYKTAASSNPEIDKVMSKSPVLKFVQDTLTSNSGAAFKPGAAAAIWKEAQSLGNSEAEKAVKQIVEGMITRGMPGDVAKQFKTLGQRASTLEELSAAFGADTGKLGGSGYLTPSAIMKIGEQNPGGIMDRARQALGQMNVSDVKKQSLLEGFNLMDPIGGVAKLGRAFSNHIISPFDRNVLGANPLTKAFVNVLRGGTQAGQPAVAQELYNAQK